MVNDSHNTVFSDALQKELSDCISYNPKKETIGVSLYSTDISNYEPGYYGGDAGCQAIFSLMMNYSIDAVIANDDVIEWFSRDDNFCNLEEILPSDLYKELEPYVVMLPDKSGKEHPYALDFSDTEVYKKGKSNLQSPRIAIFSTTRNLDEAIAAIEKLYGYSD